MISKSVGDSKESSPSSWSRPSARSPSRTQEVAVDMDNIKVEKKHGGSMEDTPLIQGIIVDKEPVHPAMPKKIEKAKIALLDTAVEVQKTEIDAKIEITDPSRCRRSSRRRRTCCARWSTPSRASGANAVFCQKGIDDLAQHFLAKKKIYAVRRVKKSDMEKLAKATGATVVTKIEELSSEELGAAALIEVRQLGEDEMTFVTGCKNPKAVSLLLRGGTEHVIDEVERSLDDAMSVVAVAIEDGKIVTGGGSTAVELAMRLREYAASVGGREQIAIDAYASALEVIPTALAENAGLDPIDILINMRKAHKDGKTHAGLNVYTGKVVDMMDQKVIEPIRVDRQAINSATDAAVLILRIDDVIAARGMGPGMGGPGGAPDMGDDSD